MADLSIKAMMEMQRELWRVHSEEWPPLEAYYARDSFLWMVEEIGEAVSLIGKHGEEKILCDEEIHKHFIEELGDILMFLNDILLRYNISAEEFSQIYMDKHNRNIHRHYKADGILRLDTDKTISKVSGEA